jgi:DEAD/DEAH box helicase domain-containing protein
MAALHRRPWRPSLVDYYTEAIHRRDDVEPLTGHATARDRTGTVASPHMAMSTVHCAGGRLPAHPPRDARDMLGVLARSTMRRRTLDTAARTGLPKSRRRRRQALAAPGCGSTPINDYGPNWQAQRAAGAGARPLPLQRHAAAAGTARAASTTSTTRFRFAPSAMWTASQRASTCCANRLENLMLLCRACHRRLETAGRLSTGLDGLAYVLGNLAPLHLMCDRADLGAFVARGSAIGAPAPVTSPAPRDVDFHAATAPLPPPSSNAGRAAPRVYLYERIPAGLGFSALLYELHEPLLTAAFEVVRECGCARGCPACVGPVLDEQPVQLETKRLTLALLEQLQP